MTQGVEGCERCKDSSHDHKMLTQTVVSGLTQEGHIEFQTLPEIAVLKVLLYCDVVTLGRLTQVNKFFKNLVDQNQVWRNVYQQSLFHGIKSVSKCGCKRSSNGLHCVAHHNSCSCTLSVKDRYRMCKNWTKGNYAEYKLLRAIRQMPSLHLEKGFLYRSDRNVVYRYRQKCNGQIQTSPVLAYKYMTDDICKFICTGERVLAVSCKGCLVSWSQSSGEVIYAYRTDHREAVTCLASRDDMIVTGSRDGIVGIWRVDEGLHCEAKLVLNDRVWSVDLYGNTLATGTAGLNQVPALRLWDVNRGTLMSKLEDGIQRNGAGILDLHFVGHNELLSCGYDTIVRLWDTRVGKCVRLWEDPFDVTVYCVKAQGAYSMVTGTALYGMARLWDQRWTKPVQKYYVSKTTSPVYSLAYDPSYLYLALDKGIHMLDFTVK